MTLQFWMILGVALLALELLLIDAQFYLVFIGLAALATGLAGWFGLPLAPPADWLLFGGLALAFTFGFRRRLYAALQARQGQGLETPFSTGTAVPTVPLAAGEEGPVEHHGSPWTGRNVGADPLRAGQPVPVRGRDGLVLLLSHTPVERTSP